MFNHDYFVYGWHHRIQPPGAWHTVYTPTKGMTTGGHMWIYESLHLTELSRGYDDSEDEEGVIRGNYSTNETHVADRQIIRMMLALPDLVFLRGEIFRKSGARPNDTNSFSTT